MGGGLVEYLNVNQNKIKVSLSLSEVKKYGIKSDSSSSARNVARSYWKIVDEAAKAGVTFNTAERLLVQAYYNDSGAELFITKLSRTADAVEKSIQKPQSSIILAARSGIFAFESIDDMVQAVLHTKNSVCYKSSLFYSEDGGYYLVCEERTYLGACSYLYRMGEFSKQLPSLMYSYVLEHSKAILLNDAIPTLIEAFTENKERG